ncbi:hypothetical protein FOCC_FOCC012571 [Frankliniella occidentalis]|nr:hypothetical protein FOCC_FOCC012571 [Frankliniella occidentalis]
MRFLILAAFVALAAAETVHYHDDTFHFATLGGSSGLKRTSFQTAQQPLLTKNTVTTKTYQSGGPLISAFAPQPQVVVSQPAFEQRFIVQQQQQQPIISKQVVTKTYQSAPLISSAVLAPAPVAQQQLIQIARPTISYEQAPAPALRQQTYAPEYQGPNGFLHLQSWGQDNI